MGADHFRIHESNLEKSIKLRKFSIYIAQFSDKERGRTSTCCHYKKVGFKRRPVYFIIPIL
jgi:hypothetical protein